MGSSKLHEFTQRQNDLALLAKALAHPARIAILEHLIKVNTCICQDIVNVLPLAQPTVSQHLRELKQAGLIRGEIEGAAVCYCLDAANWKKFEKIFLQLIKKSRTSVSCC